MAYTTLPLTGLRVVDTGDPQWLTHYNYNVDRINDELLYLSRLLDVDATGLLEGQTLTYNAATGKWVPFTPPTPPLPTTTTTA